MPKSIEEIKDNILEMCCGDKDDADYMFSNMWDETCKHLNEYGEDDEFYTNGDKYYPKDYAESIYEHSDGLNYIESQKLHSCLEDYLADYIIRQLMAGEEYTQEKFKEDVKAFVFEDFDEYMDWFMGEKGENV